MTGRLEYSDILSDIYSDIPSAILSGLLSGILSGIYSDILSGILSGILSDILSGILFGILSDILPDILWSWLRSGREHWAWMLAVEVRQGTLVVVGDVVEVAVRISLETKPEEANHGAPIIPRTPVPFVNSTQATSFRHSGDMQLVGKQKYRHRPRHVQHLSSKRT